MRILIGYDGSECSDAAIADLSRAGLPAVAEAVVLSTAQTSPLVEAAPEAAQAAERERGFSRSMDDETMTSHFLQEAVDQAERAAGQLHAYFPLWQITTETGLQHAGPALIQKAREWRPDLIVVGSQGRLGLTRLALGSVSHYVLHHADCSVRVGRQHPHSRPGPVRVLIGMDGSVGSHAALRAVAAANWPAGAQAKVVGVMDTASLSANPITLTPRAIPLAAEEQWRGETTVATQKAAGELSESGLTATATVLIGNPGDALLGEAETWSADCIFVGATGLNVLERMLLGSVSSAVSSRAHCSVEVVRSPFKD